LKSRAQLNCNASRPDTYFAKDKSANNVVAKRPFLTEKEAFISFNLQTVLFHLTYKLFYLFLKE